MLVDVAAAVGHCQGLVASGVPPAKAWNTCALSLAETARSHCYLFMLRNFIDTIAGCVAAPLFEV